MRVILNEWLLHDLRGDNGIEAQRESAHFLQRFINSTDQIAVLWDSAWMKKAQRITNETTTEVRRLGKILHLAVLRDSQKCLTLYPANLNPLPESLQALVDSKQVKDDDVYLLQIYCSLDVDSLVTSDYPLHSVLSQLQDFKIQMRDEFLRNYLR